MLTVSVVQLQGGFRVWQNPGQLGLAPHGRIHHVEMMVVGPNLNLQAGC